jgi:hypothetical protein
VIGASSRPVAVNAHFFAAAHPFHSRTVIGNLLMANGLIVTWWTGFSEISLVASHRECAASQLNHFRL